MMLYQIEEGSTVAKLTRQSKKCLAHPFSDALAAELWFHDKAAIADVRASSCQHVAHQTNSHNMQHHQTREVGLDVEYPDNLDDA